MVPVLNIQSIALGILGLVGGWMGIKHWSQSSDGQRWLTLMLAGSGVLQLIQISHLMRGVEIQWTGHLLVSWTALTLLESLRAATVHRWRPALKMVQWGFILYWAIHCSNPRLFDGVYAMPSIIFSVIALVSGTACMVSAIETARGGEFSFGLWLSGAVVIGYSVDILARMALQGFIPLNRQDFIYLWVVRNFFWLLSYVLMLKAQTKCGYQSSSSTLRPWQ
jgi:hypothetical protein